MPDTPYQAVVAAYAQALQGLFAPPREPARGRPASVPAPGELIERADQLAAAAAALRQETVSFLAVEDIDTRLGAEQHLLAQAAANLQVADGLLAAAAAAGEIEPAATRGPAIATPVFDPLLALLATPLTEVGATARSLAAPTRGQLKAVSRAELIAAVDEAIGAILDAVADHARDVLAGIVGLDTALLKQAAGMISQELSELVEKLGEQGSKLVAKAVAFVVQAFDNLLAALGKDVTDEMRKRAAEMLERLQQGDVVAGLLRMAFEVPQSQRRIAVLVESSQAPEILLGQTGAAVAALPAGFAARTKLAGQLLAALGVLKRIPATRLPMVELATAATYVALLGFVLYVGADYVDAPRLERLGRIPGVVHVVETGLAQV
jgi:hypothetical protein